MPMVPSPADDYVFDVQGFFVVRGALSPEEVAELNQLIDARVGPRGAGDGPVTGLHPLLDWGRPFVDLLDHPSVLPYLTAWVDKAVRVDSAYGLHTEAGAPQLDMHLGGTPYSPVASYHWRNGRPYLGLTVVSWALTDVPAGPNGFVCVPGSHKANAPCPDDVKRLAWDGDGLVRQLPVQAGDAVVFTEALTHGSYEWTLPVPRRVLFYRYTPGFMVFDDPAEWGPPSGVALTDRQAALFRPAFTRIRDLAGPPGADRIPRPPLP